MRVFIILTLAFFLTIKLSAQSVRFGVHIDPQICWMSPEARDVNSEGTVFGIKGGLIIDRYFQDNYALTTGISMGTQGGKLLFDYQFPLKVYGDTDTLPAGTTLKYKLQYITIPLGLKLKSNQMGYSTFYVNLGFSNQLNLKSEATTENIDRLSDDSIKDEIGWYNLGYYFGGGVEYSLGKDTSILLGIIYHNGFLDVTTAAPRVYSRILTLRLGVLF